MPDTKRQKILLFILLALLFVIYVSGLFVDVTRDAAKYAYIPKEIIQNHEWIDLKIKGEPYNQKPHFMFWLSALSYLLFGVSNFSFKLPIFIYSLLGLFFTYKLGESTYSKKVGQLSATMVAFSVIFILYNQDLHTDTVLFTSSAFALWQLIEYLKKHRTKNLILSGIALGLCLFSKGPFGAVVPFLSVMGYLVAQRKWRDLFDLRWLILVVIAFAIATPVFYQLYHNWGIKGISFFFFGNTVGRFTGTYLGRTTDPTFYIHNSAYLLLPWSIVFFFSLIQYFKNAYRKKFSGADHYLFWGFILFFLLISVSASKLPNYFMASLPVIAVLTSRTWIVNIERSRLMVKLQDIVNYMLWIVAFAGIYYFSDKGTGLMMILLAGLFLFVFFTTKPLLPADKILYRSFAALVAIGLILNLVAVPILFGYQAQPKAAKFLNQQHLAEPFVYNYPKSELKHLRRLWENPDTTMIKQFNQTPNEKHFSYNYELMFYSDYPVDQVETEDELKNALSHKNAWFYTDEEGKDDLKRQAAQIDTIITYKHFNLKHTAKLFTASGRKSPFVNRYLMKTQPLSANKNN